MIWTDWGASPKIEKATLSGNQRVAIVTSNLKWPNGIELDRGNKRIYWVDGGEDRIESIDYNGNNRVLLKRVNGFHPFGVAMIPPFLFVTDWALRTLLHKLDAETGYFLRSSYTGSGRPMDIVAYDSSRQPPGNQLHFYISLLCRNKMTNRLFSIEHVKQTFCEGGVFSLWI